ncbi:MAG: hypothetical protein RIS61_1023 [Actinomycetota bacterium]|jgi:hypothetical protein
MAKKRGRETAYDMILSLGAILATVLVVLVVSWRPKHELMQSVDFESAKSNAIATSSWPVLVPKVIPEGLSVTSARLEAESYGESGDTRWYLGFTGKNNEFISLWQSDGTFSKVKSASTNDGTCSEEVTIAGSSWQKCESTKPETRSYVKTEGELITVVSGTADWAALENFINSLQVAE